MLGMACGGPAAITPAPPTETSAATVTPPLQSSGDGPNEERGLEEQPQADATSGTAKAATVPPGSPASTIPTTQADKPAAGSELSPETATAAVQSSPGIEGPVVRVGKAAFPVELALTAEQRSQGLSSRETLPSGTGMLFVYQQERQYRFWMKEMRFPLDMVWVGADCTVVDLTLGAPIPEPDQTLEQLPRFSPVRPAQYVLEINVGESVAGDIKPGDLVEFTGDLAGRYGC